MRLDRIVVGVDGSAGARAALRQAIDLLPAGGRLVAVAAHDPASLARAGWDAQALERQLRADAERVREDAARALAAVPGAEAKVARGKPADVLLEAAREERAHLIAVGSRGSSRPLGIVLGSVATALAHRAPCPVLLARPARGERPFAAGILIGADGSEEAAAAEAVGAELAHRLGVPLRALAATGGKPVSIERLRSVEHLEWDERHPVDALVRASHEAGLLVLGSRGLHGLGALGSVSERVAHQAQCSVLVVRPDAAAAAASLEAASGETAA